MLSDQLLMAKLTLLLIFRQHFVNSCFSYSDGFLARAPEWLMDWEGKMEPRGRLHWPQRFRVVFRVAQCVCPVKTFVKNCVN